MANKMENDRVININLPVELNNVEVKKIISESLSPVGLLAKYLAPKKSDIFINLKEVKTGIDPNLGYIKDQKGNTFFKDKQSLIFHFNQKLNAFCLAPQMYLTLEKVLGIQKQKKELDHTRPTHTINLYSEDYIDSHIQHQVNSNQIVSSSTISSITSDLISSSPTKIILHGNLDYLIPYIAPERHTSIEIYRSPKKIKHLLKTRKIGENYFLDIKVKDASSSLFYDLFFLALRKVILDVEYEVPFNQKLANQNIFPRADFIKSRLETYYELLMFGIKYSGYLFEDAYNARDEKIIFSHQDKINEICTMLKKIEQQLFCFEITNEYLFTQLTTMPPASLTDLALLQKEAFEDTSLIISAFFDLIKTLLKFKPKEGAVNGNN